MSRTLFEKLWKIHEVARFDNGESLIRIDRVFLHERTGSIALKGLEEKGRSVANPKHVFCTMDHIVDTKPGRSDSTQMPSGKNFITATRNSARRADIELFDLDSQFQGIVHVISPELGIALPG
ncbi:MAG: 3-isopropylmalate dehydratase, partial [Porticoccaceae bacterium]|nr:3-isopropylmalate dehydratase [Porticoccaceae bacterium]